MRQPPILVVRTQDPNTRSGWHSFLVLIFLLIVVSFAHKLRTRPRKRYGYDTWLQRLLKCSRRLHLMVGFTDWGFPYRVLGRVLNRSENLGFGFWWIKASMVIYDYLPIPVQHKRKLFAYIRMRYEPKYSPRRRPAVTIG